MRIFLPIVFFFFIFQAHAGELIILDSYYLERMEREPSVEMHKIEQIDDARGDARGPVTHIGVNHRSIDDYKIRRKKNHRAYGNKDDSPLLQYDF